MHDATQYLTGVSLNTSSSDGELLFQTNQTIPFVSTDAKFSAAFASGVKAVTVIANVRTGTEEVYVCSLTWISAFALATFAMICAAIVGFYADWKSQCPDYLGYVSSLAQESAHVDIPIGAVTIDDIERARLLNSLKVRLGDVGEDNDGLRQLRFGTMERAKRARKETYYNWLPTSLSLMFPFVFLPGRSYVSSVQILMFG